MIANDTTLSDANVQQSLDYILRAEAANGVAVMGEIGCSIYTLRFQIPIAFRFAYNVLGATAYAERVKQMRPCRHRPSARSRRIRWGW